MIFPVFDKGGGIQRAVVELSAQLVTAGHDVHGVANTWDPDAARITFHRVPMIKPNNPLQMATFCLASTVALKTWLARERFDIVHSHGAATLEADVVTAQSCHLAWVVSSSQALRRFSRPWIRRHLNPPHPSVLAIERYQYTRGHYRKITAVSGGVKREIMALYGVPDGDITVVPNGVNLDEFGTLPPASARQALRAGLGLTPRDRVLLFVANEFPRKGLGLLLEALAHLPRNVHLLCVGRGDPGPYLATVAHHDLQQRVHFVPHTTAVRNEYAVSDLFVVPTYYEAFGLVIVEAAAAGLPLLCTAAHGPRDIIVDGVNGLFLKHEARDIADKVWGVLSNPAWARALGDNARATARAYRWETIKDRYVAVYQEAVERKQRGAAPRAPRT
ncbi:MAG: glycosyltransferase family 4 protein [Chloroflexota bacterium]